MTSLNKKIQLKKTIFGMNGFSIFKYYLRIGSVLNNIPHTHMSHNNSSSFFFGF